MQCQRLVAGGSGGLRDLERCDSRGRTRRSRRDACSGPRPVHPGMAARRSGEPFGAMASDRFTRYSCAACQIRVGSEGPGREVKTWTSLRRNRDPVEGESRFRNDEISRMVRQDERLQSQSKGAQPVKPRAKGEDPDRGPLLKLHRGFRDASSLVLHRFGPGTQLPGMAGGDSEPDDERYTPAGVLAHRSIDRGSRRDRVQCG